MRWRASRAQRPRQAGGVHTQRNRTTLTNQHHAVTHDLYATLSQATSQTCQCLLSFGMGGFAVGLCWTNEQCQSRKSLYQGESVSIGTRVVGQYPHSMNANSDSLYRQTPGRCASWSGSGSGRKKEGPSHSTPIPLTGQPRTLACSTSVSAS